MQPCTIHRANENQQQDSRNGEPMGTNILYKTKKIKTSQTKHTYTEITTRLSYAYILYYLVNLLLKLQRKNNFSFLYFNP